MNTPSALGRQDTDSPSDAPDPRASTTLVAEARLPFEGGAVGEVLVQLLRSTQSEDRGGLVLSVTIADQGSSFIPYARLIENGVELHIAGEIEAKSVASAILTVLQANWPVSAQEVRPNQSFKLRQSASGLRPGWSLSFRDQPPSASAVGLTPTLGHIGRP
jgi:hypothetical protein